MKRADWCRLAGYTYLHLAGKKTSILLVSTPSLPALVGLIFLYHLHNRQRTYCMSPLSPLLYPSHWSLQVRTSTSCSLSGCSALSPGTELCAWGRKKHKSLTMTVFLTNSEAVSQLCPLYCLSHTVLLNSLTVSFCPHSHLCFIIWEFQQEPTGQQEMVQLHSFVWSSAVVLSGYILKFNRSLQFSVCITAFFALIYLISLTIVSELDAIYISRHEQTCTCHYTNNKSLSRNTDRTLSEAKNWLILCLRSSTDAEFNFFVKTLNSLY